MNPSSLLMAIVNKLSLSLILVYWTKDKFRCVHVVHIDTETFRHFLFPPSFHSPYFPSLFLFFFLKSQNCLRVQISYLALPIWDIWFGKKKMTNLPIYLKITVKPKIDKLWFQYYLEYLSDDLGIVVSTTKTWNVIETIGFGS